MGSVHQHDFPTATDIKDAADRLRGVIHETPISYSTTFSQMAGLPIWLKLENMQKTGSFKIRGAYNMVTQLTDEERARGVIAASAGNHAQGVAFAAHTEGVPSTIVMPEAASLAKVMATQQYGATVVLKGNSYDDAYRHALSLQRENGFTYIHAFDHPAIIAGQGTVGLELLSQLPQVDTVVVPMGGGGLVTGIALYLKSIRPSVRVYGVQAAAVCAYRQSFDASHAKSVPVKPTIADGIAVLRPGKITYPLAKKYVDDILTVEEEEIARAMVLLMERAKIVTEGAGAAALAAAIHGKVPKDSGTTLVVLSGGNVDVGLLSRIITHGLVQAGRYLRLTVTLVDKPGALQNLLRIIATNGANVVSIEHHRLGPEILLGETEVEIDLETRNPQHRESLVSSIQSHGYRLATRD